MQRDKPPCISDSPLCTASSTPGGSWSAPPADNGGRGTVLPLSVNNRRGEACLCLHSRWGNRARRVTVTSLKSHRRPQAGLLRVPPAARKVGGGGGCSRGRAGRSRGPGPPTSRQQEACVFALHWHLTHEEGAPTAPTPGHAGHGDTPGTGVPPARLCVGNWEQAPCGCSSRLRPARGCRLEGCVLSSSS